MSSLLMVVLTYPDAQESFRHFLVFAQANPRARDHTLHSFLIMPVQRIPRYKMLLQEMIKFSSDIPSFDPQHTRDLQVRCLCRKTFLIHQWSHHAEIVPLIH